MERIPFVNFGYVQTRKATKNCHTIKGLASAIQYHGVQPIQGHDRDSLLRGSPPPEWSIVVYYEGSCYIINDDLLTIAPDGQFQGNRERQRQLRSYLTANFPNFPEN